MVDGARDINKRVAALDGLRALAVTIVIFGHLAPTYVGGGFIGVDLFFTLSGYLITSILIREFESRGTISFGHFYLRRAARLMPALALVLVVACAAVWFSSDHIFKWDEVLYAATYTMNWARAFGAGDSLILGHTWSLGIEEQFYLLWPPILLAILRWRPKVAPVAALLLAVASVVWSISLYLSGATQERIYNGFDTHAGELLIGCALSFLPLNGQVMKLLAKFWFIPVLAIVAIFNLANAKFLSLGGYAVIGLVAAWLIAALQERSWLAIPLENRLAAYVGRISYGLYLWHYLLLGLAEVHGLHGLGRDLVVLVVTFGAAALSYRFVEAPILKATRSRLAVIPRIEDASAKQ